MLKYVYCIFLHSCTMPRSSGDDRLAKRLHVLQLRQLDPNMSWAEMGRRAGVNWSTARSIVQAFGNADISLGAPWLARVLGGPRSGLRAGTGVFRVFFDNFGHFFVPLGT